MYEKYGKYLHRCVDKKNTLPICFHLDKHQWQAQESLLQGLGGPDHLQISKKLKQRSFDVFQHCASPRQKLV